MGIEGLVTAVIINYKTPDLVRRVVASFRQHYPSLPLLLIDNGSHDESEKVLQAFHDQQPQTTRLLLNANNLHHGPAMDQALREIATPFVLFLDSDCHVINGGFVEQMLNKLQEQDSFYSVGKRISMDTRGFDVSEGMSNAILYIRPLCMMLKRDMYLTLPPFERHGTPCLRNMRSAAERSLGLLDFPVEQFVEHEGRGTAGRFGYQLGWRGKLNYLLHKIGL